MKKALSPNQHTAPLLDISDVRPLLWPISSLRSSAGVRFWRDVSPLRSRAWTTGAALALALQLAYSLALSPGFLFEQPADIWGVLVAGLLALAVIMHLVKRQQAALFVREGRWARVKFDTRLGTFSPR